MSDSDNQKTQHLRACILKHLYEWFKQYPLASIELRQLSDTCRVNAQDLNWNMAYLEKKGLINLNLAVDCPPFIACTASLTAAGIDLIEDVATFNAQFLSQSKDAS